MSKAWSAAGEGESATRPVSRSGAMRAGEGHRFAGGESVGRHRAGAGAGTDYPGRSGASIGPAPRPPPRGSDAGRVDF